MVCVLGSLVLGESTDLHNMTTALLKEVQACLDFGSLRPGWRGLWDDQKKVKHPAFFCSYSHSVIHRKGLHLASLYAALAVLFLGFACTMNTKIISRKNCKGAQFHFPFWKENQLCQGWTGEPQPLCRRVSLPRY